MTRRFLFALALAIAPSAFADTLVIPLVYNGPGAYGATWHTSVTVSNRSQRSSLGSPGNLQFVYCEGAPDGCTGTDGSPYLIANMTGRVIANAPHGMIINDFEGAGFATAHIAAEPRDPDTEGTEIPIAHGADFGTSKKMVNVPTSVTSGHPVRVLLRLYAILHDSTGDPHPTGTVVITAYDVKNSSVAAAQIEVTLKVYAPGEPGYAEVDLSRFASIAPFVNLDLDAGHIDPNPQTSCLVCRMNVWGFATITDNATNDVITIAAR